MQSFDKTVETIANAVYNYLTEKCSGVNVTQWCKKEQCWIDIKENINISIVSDLSSELLSKEKVSPSGIESLNDPEKKIIDAMHFRQCLITTMVY